MPRDPRWYQIAVLAGLLAYGMVALDFDVTPLRALVLVGAALVTQWALGLATGSPKFEPKSALISALSLCLLLRTGSHVLAALVAVARWRASSCCACGGKHVFNPTNFGIWRCCSPRARPCGCRRGSGASVALFGFLMACARHARRAPRGARRRDVRVPRAPTRRSCSAARCGSGNRWRSRCISSPSGALLLFAFFMISDPRTTPDSRAGRLLFAALVAVGAAFVQFVLFRTNGLLWSLAALLAARAADRSAAAGHAARSGRRRPRRDGGGARRRTATRRRTGRRGRRRCSASSLRSARRGPRPGTGVLRLLRRRGRRQAVQPRVAGGASCATATAPCSRMANDYKGDPQEFALVVPVPDVLEQGADPRRRAARWIDHLDAYSRAAAGRVPRIPIRARAGRMRCMMRVGRGDGRSWPTAPRERR